MDSGLFAQRKTIFEELSNHPERTVADIFSSFPKIQCEKGSPYNEFLLTDEEMRNHNGIIASRFHLYQMFIIFGQSMQKNLLDPLIGDVYDQVLKEMRYIFASAPLLGPNVVKKLLNELNLVFSNVYPLTIQKLTDELGISEEQELKLPITGNLEVHRIRYQEETPIETKETNHPNPLISKFLPPSMGPNKIIHMRIKKKSSTHHHEK